MALRGTATDVLKNLFGAGGAPGGGQKRSWDEANAGGEGGQRAMMLKYSGRENIPSDNLYITGLPAGINKETVNQMFTGNGYTVQRCRVMDDAMGTGYSAAMVQLGNQEEAAAAMALFSGQIVELAGQEGGAVAPAGGKAWGGGGGGGWESNSWDSKGGKSWGSKGGSWDSKGGKGHDSKGSKGWDSKGGNGWESNSWDAKGGGGGWGKGGDSWGGKSDGGWGKGDGGWGKGDAGWGKGGGDSWGKGGGGGYGKADSWGKGGDSWGGDKGKGKGKWDSGKGGKKGGGKDEGPKPLMMKYSGKENTPSENLYLTGLPNAVDKATLEQMFTGAGFTVQNCRVIYDQWGSGYSAGMVQLADQAEADSAITMFHGQIIEIEGMANGGGGGGYGGGGKGDKGKGKKGKAMENDPNFVKPLMIKYAGADGEPSDNLYIRGIPSSMGTDQLQELFTSSGLNVQKTRIIPDQWGCGYCAGMVQVSSTEEAAAAIEAFNGMVLTPEGAAAPAA